MSRAASNQPAEFTLTVTSEDISYSQQYTVTAGNTLTIDDLEPATYTLTCTAIINNFTYSDSQTAVVDSNSEPPYIFVNLASDNKTISLMNYTIDADGTITITFDGATYTKQ